MMKKRLLSLLLILALVISVSTIQVSAAGPIMYGIGFTTGSNLRLRYAPEIVWSLDDSITYGARNLRRTIQKELEDPISEAIIDSFEHPISSIHITVEEDSVKLNIQ